MKIALLTSVIWEGAYILKTLLDQNLPCENVLLQKTWWRDENSYEYSEEYYQHLNARTKSNKQQYYTIEEVIGVENVAIHEIGNINSKESQQLLETLKPDILIVAGSRIIKPRIIDNFEGWIVNFHTGYLPYYRGPYSEFWAMYNNDYDKIGTTIHVLDKGIDTGKILEVENVSIEKTMTPEEAHVLNTFNGAQLLAKAVAGIINGVTKPYVQNEANASYYSYPTDNQIEELEKRLNKKIELSFAD